MEPSIPSLQDTCLALLRKEGVPVSIFLINGIQLTGIIEAFDSYVVLLKSGSTQLVYKHAISTVVPSRAFAFTPNSDVDEPTALKRTPFGRRRSGNSTGRE